MPRVLTQAQIDNLAEEVAAFHLSCAEIAPMVPPTSKTIKSDAIHLLDLVSERHAAARFGLDQSRLDIVRRHTHRFLVAVLESGYDYWQRIPVLIDWNLGNFSVEFDTVDTVDKIDKIDKIDISDTSERVDRFSLFSSNRGSGGSSAPTTARFRWPRTRCCS